VTLTAIVIDNDTASCIILSNTLKREGFLVTTVPTFTEAKQLLTPPSTPCDILLLNFILPDGSGIEFLRNNAVNTEVILMAEQKHTKKVLKAIECGVAIDYVPKPIDTYRLKAAILNVKRLLSLKSKLNSIRVEVNGIGRTKKENRLKELRELTNRITS
jgi:two-component system nitrogen regulation response regulator GlnG